MKRFDCWIRFTAFFVVLTAGSPAQERVRLTVDQSVEIGLKRSKFLHSSQMRVKAAESKSSESHASQLPSLKVAGSYTRLSDVPPFTQTIPAGTFGSQQPPISFTLSPVVLNNYNLRASVQQPLFTGFRLQSNASIAELSAQAIRQEFDKDQAELIYSITNSYWTLFKAIKFQKVIDENVEQVKAHLDEVENLMKQGMATTNEVLRVQVQLSNAELLQIDAKNNVHLATIALNNVIGQPLETEIQLESSPDTLYSRHLERQPNDLNALTQQAMQHRPELKAVEYRVEAGEAGVDLARSGWYPQIYLTGNYYYARPNQRILPTEDRFSDTWDIGITATLDIWNWGSTIHQSEQAQAQLAQSQDALAQLRDAITLEVTQNHLMLNQSNERIRVSDQAVKQAEENYRVTNEKFKLGVALNTDLLDAEGALLQAKWNHIQTQVDYELAQARLHKSVGL